MTKMLESAIIGAAIMALINNGFRVEVSDRDGGGLFIYAAPDGGARPQGGYAHWILLVPGNGADVISDYSINLETVLQPVNDFAARWADAA